MIFAVGCTPASRRPIRYPFRVQKVPRNVRGWARKADIKALQPEWMPDGQAHSQFWNDRGGPRFPQRARSVAPRRDKKEQQRRKSCLSGLETGPHVRYQRLLSVLALVATQGVQLGLVQSLRDVRDQIGRVFDADRQPDRGVENAYFLADVGRNPGVGHAC